MTEQVATQTQDNEGVKTPPETTKYAGRFDSIEELEKGYTELDKSYSAKVNMQAKYEELEASVKMPDEYSITDSIADYDDGLLQAAITEAKAIGANQAQFEKIVNKHVTSEAEKNTQSKSHEDDINAKFGKDNVEAIKHYIKENTSLSDNTINRLSIDEIAFFEKKRSDFLNTNTNFGSTARHKITRVDVDKAYAQVVEANKSSDRNLKESTFKSWQDMAKLFREQQ